MGIEFILFDLSEVLMNGLMNLPQAIERAVTKGYLTLGVSPNFFREKYSNGGISSLFLGDISEEEFWEGFLDSENSPFSVQKLKEVTRENFWEFMHSRSILNKLKSNGYNLTLFSDHGKEWIEYIEKNFSFLSIFDNKIYSFDSHYTKKDREAFNYTINKINLNPDKTLFIDDMLNNTKIAQESGIKQVHCYRGIERLVRYFKELEIRGYS